LGRGTTFKRPSERLPEPAINNLSARIDDQEAIPPGPLSLHRFLALRPPTLKARLPPGVSIPPLPPPQ
jgi:hypothetical protein